jgi:hypothetical protein
MSEAGCDNQLGQVSVPTNSAPALHRHNVRPGPRSSTRATGPSGKDGIADSAAAQAQEPTSMLLEVTHRTDNFYDASDRVRQVGCQTDSVAFGATLEAVQGLTRQDGRSVSRPDNRPGMVVEQGEHSERQDVGGLQTNSKDLHRFQFQGMGCSSGAGSIRSQRSMVLPGTPEQYQLEGDESSDNGSTPVYSSSQKPTSTDCLRQLHGSFLCEQTGRYAVGESDGTRVGAPHVSTESQLQTVLQTHPGTVKLRRRYTQSREPGHPDRVGPTSLPGGADLVEMGRTPGGPLCHEVQREVEQICLTHAGRAGLASRRHVNLMEASSSVCLSSKSPDRPGTKEVSGRTVPADLNSAIQTRESVVSTAVTVSSGSTLADPNAVQHANSTSLRPPVSAAGKSKSVRLETLQQAIRSEGFSQSVAEKASLSKRSSTLAIYDSKWNMFVVADFLEWLFEGPKKLAPSTIEGYRASLSKVLLHTCKTNISTNKTISDMITYFKIQRPRSENTVPKWDLSLVLKILKKPPFYDLRTNNMMYNTWKTVFLALLAVGSRRGELHAIDVRSIRDVGNYRWLYMRPNPKFLAKNHNLNTDKGMLKEFVIESLKDVTGKDFDNDYDLCPVRALKYYVNRTESSRKDISQLFITYKKGPVGPAKKNTISSWVKQLLLYAYEHAEKDESILRLCQTSAHEVRAIASSLALYHNVALDDILGCCRWASSSTFSSHYLRDMTDLGGKIHELLPLSVAGSVLRAST